MQCMRGLSTSDRGGTVGHKPMCLDDSCCGWRRQMFLSSPNLVCIRSVTHYQTSSWTSCQVGDHGSGIRWAEGLCPGESTRPHTLCTLPISALSHLSSHAKTMFSLEGSIQIKSLKLRQDHVARYQRALCSVLWHSTDGMYCRPEEAQEKTIFMCKICWDSDGNT